MQRGAALSGSLLMTGLAACGGGGGSQSPQSTPAPPVAVSAPAATATPAMTAPVVAAAPAVSNDTAEFRQNAAAYAKVGLLTAHDAGWTGKGVTVAVIDDGIDAAGGAFDGRLSALSKDFGYDEALTVGGQYATVARTGLAGPYTDHGIKVAAVIAAARDGKGTVGVAPGASIAALRTDVSRPGNGVEQFPDDGIAAALTYAGNQAIRIVNLSLSRIGRSEPIVAAAERYVATGGLIVFAAGNSGGADPDMVANITAANRAASLFVGGLAASGDALDPRSNRAGALADRFLVAPMEIATAGPGGDTVTASGTSFAAPVAAGAAALLLEKWPQLTGAQAGDILLATARDLGAPGTDTVFGRGLLDIAAAISPSEPMFGSAQKSASVAAAAVVLPRAFGPTELRRALGDVTVTDRWGRDFRVALGGHVGQASALASLRGAAEPVRGGGFAAPGFETRVAWRDERGRAALTGASIGARVGGARIGFARGSDPSATIAASPLASARTGTAAYAPQADTHAMFGSSNGRLTFQLSRGDSRDGSATAATARWQPGRFTLSASGVAERGTLFGQPATGALRLAAKAQTVAVEASRQWSLGSRWAATFDAGAGLTRVTVPQGSLFRSVGPLLSSQLAAELAGRFDDGGVLRLSAAQPLTIERGRATVDLPNRYDLATRSVLSEDRRIDLASDRRALLLSAGYDRPVGRGGSARLMASRDMASRDTAALAMLSFGF